MAYYDEIYDLLGTAVTAFYDTLNLEVIYQGIGAESTPPGGADRWVELTMFNVPAQNYGMANDGPTLAPWFFRIGVCGKPGVGLQTLYELAGQTVAQFGKGYVLDADTNTRIEEAPSINTILEQDDYILLPVTIRMMGTQSASS